MPPTTCPLDKRPAHRLGSAMMKRLYDWMMRMAGHDKAPQALFWVAFVESSVFPIPPDVMLIPMILARRAKAWLYATICTVGSVIGGLAGYAIGYYPARVCRPPGHRLLRLGAEIPGLGAAVQRLGRVDHDRQGLDALPIQGADHRRRRLQDERRALHPGEHRRAVPCASIWWPASSTGSASRSANSSRSA